MKNEKPLMCDELEKIRENQDPYYDVADRFVSWVYELIDSGTFPSISLCHPASSFFTCFGISSFDGRYFDPFVKISKGRFINHLIELRDDILFVNKDYYAITYDPNCTDPDKIYCPIQFNKR